MGRSLTVAAAGAMIVLAGCSPSSGDSTTTTSDSPVPASTLPSSSTSSTTMVPTVVVAVSETFAVLSESPRDAVIPGLADVVDVEMALPPGAVVVPVLETLRVDGELAEVVAEVELADGSTDRFGVVLVADGDRWLIAYTVRAP